MHNRQYLIHHALADARMEVLVVDIHLEVESEPVCGPWVAAVCQSC
jgi:hypothetical protein